MSVNAINLLVHGVVWEENKLPLCCSPLLIWLTGMSCLSVISTRPHAGYWLYLRNILNLQIPNGWCLGAEVAFHRLASQLWTWWYSTSEPLQSAKQLICDSSPHRSAVNRDRLLSYIQSPQGRGFTAKIFIQHCRKYIHSEITSLDLMHHFPGVPKAIFPMKHA